LLGDTWAELNRQPERFALGGRDALAVAHGYASGDPLDRTVGLAAVNALTRCLFDRAAWVPASSADSIGNLDPQPGETVGMIGYFASLVPRITARGARLVVIELRADLVGERDGARVTLDADELQACDKVLATGTLLLNDTLERMLGLCRRARRIAMIGPSVGCPPDPLFARGVTLMGGTWISDPAAYVDALRAGEPTAPASRKFALARDDYPGWATLLQRAAGRDTVNTTRGGRR
ncbi:MAG: Rossmann-like domain-containing protein, partial [Burkholderiales bacterium]